MDKKDLGKKIREIRKSSKTGLRELCRRAEITPATLTAIEKGTSSPTLATINKIVEALDLDLAGFFAKPDGENPSPVFFSKDTHIISDKNREYTYLFPSRADLKFEIMHECILPTEKRSEWEKHNNDIGGTIISGGPAKLEIENQDMWTLRKGDSFYIPKNIKHRLTNIGKKPLKQITVMLFHHAYKKHRTG